MHGLKTQKKKNRKFRWEEKWNFRLEKVVQFGRKPRYVAVPDRLSSRGPGTGTNYEKRAMHKSIPPALGPPGLIPRPFLPWMADSRGWGFLS